jgi:predicted  nucleic acid-binding Zn-ribbon protein
MSRASSLYRLQQLDIELMNSHERIKEIQQILEDDEAIVGLREILEISEIQLKEARTTHSTARYDVDTQRAKIEQTEKTLYGGLVRNPKELQERQQEAESLKRYLVTLEDRLLEAMIHLDEMQEQRDIADQALTRALENQTHQHSNLKQELESLLTKIERLDAEREAAVASVVQEDLELYEDIRKRLGGRAIVLVQEGSCSACGLILAHSVQQTIRSGSDLIRCGQCGRILYAG